MKTPINKSIFNETGCIRKELLLNYRDNILSREEKHEVEEHLVDCILCSEALEGLVMVQGSEVFTELQQEVSKITNPAPVYNFRPWLAAATLAGVIIISYITYMQFSNVADERLAVKEDTLIQSDLPAVEQTIPDNSQEIVPPPATLPANKELKSGVGSEQPRPEPEFSVANETPADAVATISAPVEVESKTEGASTVAMEIQKPVLKEKYSFPAPMNMNANITYVDNLKVIDYTNYQFGNIKEADMPRNTPSKYENKKVQAAEAEYKPNLESPENEDYIDMVADPIILFNNGRFESANQGFDKLLSKNSNDQNAVFYKGLSLFNLGKYNQALELLEPVGKDTANPFMEEARFYTAKSYIGKGDIVTGKNILLEIVNKKGFYAKQANEELSKMN